VPRKVPLRNKLPNDVVRKVSSSLERSKERKYMSLQVENYRLNSNQLSN
jgi:hypothetical protein